jgi:hypothetical protein
MQNVKVAINSCLDLNLMTECIELLISIAMYVRRDTELCNENAIFCLNCRL